MESKTNILAGFVLSGNDLESRNLDSFRWPPLRMNTRQWRNPLFSENEKRSILPWVMNNEKWKLFSRNRIVLACNFLIPCFLRHGSRENPNMAIFSTVLDKIFHQGFFFWSC